MTPERPPLPPNIISLCSPWLPKNGIQGHFSIYCRLFPPGALSNSLRNLLEVSCNILVRDMRSGNGVIWNGAELLRNERDLTTKEGEQPWPQLICCASICCCVYGCIFQENRIVARSLGEEWYIAKSIRATRAVHSRRSLS